MSRTRAGLISLGVGLAAAGVGAVVGVAAEHVTVGRPLRAAGRPPDDGEDYGSLRSDAVVVVADDGTKLHAELDEVPGAADADRDAPTLVFSHGYALNLDSWHFQRKALRGRFRMVFWDQRGHGRSERGREGSATIDQVGADLRRVIDELAPSGPLVLIGHSMGGMTVMSLAARDPELFEQRVTGVALISTSAGGLERHDLGLPGLGKIVQRLAPGALSTLARRPGLVDRGRKIGSDLEMVLVRKWSYSSPVSPALVRFTAEMIASTSISTVADFLPQFARHDKLAALQVLGKLEVLVLVGDGDLLTPARYSEDIVALLPGAEHVVVSNAGHMVLLEHPDVVTDHLLELIARAGRAGAPGRSRGRRPRRSVTALAPLRSRRTRSRRRGGAA